MLRINSKINMQFSRWIADRDWRLIFLLILPLSFVVFISLSADPTNPLSTFSHLRSFILSHTFQQPQNVTLNSTQPPTPTVVGVQNRSESAESRWRRRRKDELDRSRMAVCLVGGARRFELTGPSMVENILKEYPNSDLFLHSPLDQNSFKLSLLKRAPRLASVRIFEPKPLPQTESQVQVLTAANSPSGIQGLLQYFNLVEGCLTMIEAYQMQNNFKYDWIVRTRVDGYWNAPLHPRNFVPGRYLVPPGSNYGGLNDRFGVGDLNTSTVALSRLSLIPKLESAGFRQLNSETAFRAQLTTQGIPYLTKRLPFCVVSDWQYSFPPRRYGVPVAALSSPGPLSGAKCRACKPVCCGRCVAKVMLSLDPGWSWTYWMNETIELCDAHGEWEAGWERIFDRVAGKKLAAERKRVHNLKLQGCIDDFKEMKRRTTGRWESPPVEEICRLGLEEPK
ncbi:hypothetical protein CJ030_MR8G015397 [Morella rubra]|uniref:DUF7796 domain-containing protein n=1 Tax=Morella rubra TaxID=262757 RepID=A0A6A1USV6_9ROSI|nr:hypothetical protein CJ030_MR8G015397 [Morella rubra]